MNPYPFPPEPAPEVSVVVPMFNEEENVADTVHQLRDALDRLTPEWEIVLVNDGSTDRTLDAAREVARDVPEVRVVSYALNGGRGKALRTGLAQARGDIVVTIEADLSWGTEVIGRLVNALRHQPDVDAVIASPHHPEGKLEDVPWKRALVSRVGNRVVGAAMPGRFHTVSGMTRAYRRHVVESLELESDGKEIHIEILTKAIALGYRVTEIPAVLSGRRKGNSKFKFRATAIPHLTFCLFEKPALLFGAAGLLCIGVGGLIGLYLTWLRVAHGVWHPDRPLMTVLLLLILAGTQILSFGFISTQIVGLRRELYKVQRGYLKIQRQLEVTGRAGLALSSKLDIEEQVNV
jgi:glycosyltransferase involved in cell wall biosynthesis